MKFGLRKPSLKKSIKARTTGKLKRKFKKAINPFYGKKGMGWVRNPKKALYNKIYNKTSFGLSDVAKFIIPNKPKQTQTNDSTFETTKIKNIINNKRKENTMKKPFYKKWWFWVIIVILLFGSVSSGETNDTKSTSTPIAVTLSTSKSTTTKSTTTTKASTTTTTTKVSTTTATTKATTTTAKPTTTTTKQTYTVYISATGSKYHSYSSCSNMKNARAITLEDAKQLGYSACSRCNPPR